MYPSLHVAIPHNMNSDRYSSTNSSQSLMPRHSLTSDRKCRDRDFSPFRNKIPPPRTRQIAQKLRSREKSVGILRGNIVTGLEDCLLKRPFCLSGFRERVLPYHRCTVESSESKTAEFLLSQEIRSGLPRNMLSRCDSDPKKDLLQFLNLLKTLSLNGHIGQSSN